MFLTRIKSFSRGDGLVALILGLLALLTRGLYIVYFTTPLQNLRWLPWHNHQRAFKVLSGQDIHFADAWGVYYLFLSLEYRLFSWLAVPEHLWPMWAVMFNVAFSAIGAGYLYLLTRKFASRFFAILTTLLYILYFPSIFFDTLLLNEPLYEMLLIVGMCLLMVARISFRHLTVAGVVFGLALALRPILMPFIPFLLLWVWWGERKLGWLPYLKKMAIFLVAMIVPIVPIMYANSIYSHHHRWQLSGSLGPNLVLTQCQLKKVSYKNDEGSFWFSPPVRWATSLPDKEYDVPFYETQFYVGEAVACAVAQPEVTVSNLENVPRLFWSILYPYPKPGTVLYYEVLVRIWRVVTILCFAAFLLYPFRADKMHRRMYVLLMGLVASLFLSVYLANPGEERYLVPYVWVFFVGVGGLLGKASAVVYKNYVEKK